MALPFSLVRFCAEQYPSIMVYGKDETILVVGSGCFGISTAYHLVTRGFKNVTVVDRSDILPAPDACEYRYQSVLPVFIIYSQCLVIRCTDKGEHSIIFRYIIRSLIQHPPVVRSSYSDNFYAQLAQEAIRSWKSKEWENTYHEWVDILSIPRLFSTELMSSEVWSSCLRLFLGSTQGCLRRQCLRERHSDRVSS